MPRRCRIRFASPRTGATRCGISDILCPVGKRLLLSSFFAAVLVFGGAIAFNAVAQQAPAPATPQQTAPAQLTPVPPPAVPSPSAQTAPAGPVIVIDPAHGGTDPGAHSDSATEKDVVLQLARSVRAALERQGFRAVLTRNDDSNPSYDDRSAMANGYRDAIFVSLHASSTGGAGTVRAYYMQFAAPIPAAPVPLLAAPSGAPAKPAAAVALAEWGQAQRPYVSASHRLADQLQSEFAQAFAGSPPYSAGVAVRALRSVTAPAVAVEVSSVSAPPDQLAALGDPLGNAIARGVSAFRSGGGGGAR